MRYVFKNGRWRKSKMRGVEYATDAEALDDFMATHWAWLEEE